MTSTALDTRHQPLSSSSQVVLSNKELSRVAAILNEDAGIHLTDEKISLVHSRLIKRLRVLGISSFSDYCDLVESEPGEVERKELLLALTTNVTRFFREPHHFEHLIKEVLPPLIERAKKGERIRIWSAGCSNGQEPYSIAAVLLSLLPDAHKFDIKILASDIDRKMVLEGRKGIYSEKLMQKMPANLTAKYFEESEGLRQKMFSANEQMKSLVAFRELNLNANHWPMKGKFQVIFCRNVVIYFNEETQKKIWTRFKNQMDNGGHLFIGHSERLSGPDEKSFTKAGVTTYQLEPKG